MLKVFQPLTTPFGTNEQTGVGQATVATDTTFRHRGIGAAADKAMFLLDVSAASGTSPSMTVTIQGRDPGSLKWVDIVAFTPVTGVTAAPQTKTVDPLYFQLVRVSVAVSGTTPSFTFSCGGIFLKAAE